MDNNRAYALIRTNEELLEACRFRHLRGLIIGFLQQFLGADLEDATKAVDFVMGYNAHYGMLRA